VDLLLQEKALSIKELNALLSEERRIRNNNQINKNNHSRI
jgi:hypothetical protein